MTAWLRASQRSQTGPSMLLPKSLLETWAMRMRAAAGSGSRPGVVVAVTRGLGVAVGSRLAGAEHAARAMASRTTVRAVRCIGCLLAGAGRFAAEQDGAAIVLAEAI